MAAKLSPEQTLKAGYLKLLIGQSAGTNFVH